MQSNTRFALASVIVTLSLLQASVVILSCESLALRVVIATSSLMMVGGVYFFWRSWVGIISRLNHDWEKAVQQARLDAQMQTARALVDDEDLLTALRSSTSGGDIADPGRTGLERVIRRLYAALHESIGLRPLLSQGDRTSFDPATQATFDRLAIQEDVEVVMPGWKVHRQLIKRPLVRKVVELDDEDS